MNFPLFVSRRYLFSKKSTHAINLISVIAVLGVAVATMAMVVVMSSFNGFADLIASLFTEFDPQLKVQPVSGKAAPADDAALVKVKQLPFVAVATECVEDQALAVYRDRQMMVTVKGVEANFDSLTNIRNILYGDGEFRLSQANLDYAVPGIWIAKDLGTGTDWPDYLHIYAPQRQGQYDMSNPTEAFAEDSVLSPGVVFQVKQSRYDRKYILTSIALARRLFDRQGELTSLELRMKPGVDIDEAKKEIKAILGNRFTVKDRYEQQADNFKVMQVEKLFAYAFLTFILLVACFNIVGSLSMLIIDKRDDIATLLPWSQRPHHHAHFPARRTPNSPSWGRHRHRSRASALPPPTAIRPCEAWQQQRQLHRRCLSRECTPVGRGHGLPHRDGRGMAGRLFPRTLHEPQK